MKAIAQLNGQTLSCEQLRAAAGGPAVPMVVKYAGATEEPSDNIFISGLPSPQVDTNVLTEVMQALGCKVIRCRAMADTRGTGFSQAMVQVESQEQAQTAIAMLNGEIFPQEHAAVPAGTAPTNNRGLSVKYAKDAAVPNANLYIMGLPSPQVKLDTFEQLFSSLGLTVVRTKTIPDTMGRGTSCAMVELGSIEEGTSAVQALDGQIVEGLEADWEGGKGAKGGKGGKDAWDGGKGGKGAWDAGGKGWSATGDFWPAGVKGAGKAWAAGPKGGDDAWGKGGWDAAGKGGWDAAGKGWGGDDAGGGKGSWDVNTILSSLGLGGGKGAWDGGGKGGWDAGGKGGWDAAGGKGWGDDAAGKGWDAKGYGKAAGKPAGAASPYGLVQKGAGKGLLTVKYAGTGAPSGNLFVKDLPGDNVDVATLTNLFTALEFTVTRAKVMPGSGTCAAMVELGSQAEAALAIEILHGQALSLADLYPNGAPGAAGAGAAGGSIANRMQAATAGVPIASPGAVSANMVVRFSGKAGADGVIAPSEYITIGGFSTGATPTEEEMKTQLAGVGLAMKRMRVMKGQVMVQLASIEEASKGIDALNGKAFGA